MRKIFFLFFILFSVIFPGTGANFCDSTQVRLLTVMPRSNEVYTIFGHTAIRVFDPSRKIDVVFNYGLFDFNAPNFIYRYVKGETDYSIGEANYRMFVFNYSSENATVIEQVLDIPVPEKEKLIEALQVNMQPGNREYRYNHFLDNCATRPRDLIEQFCGGRLVYTESDRPVTFRRLVHECTDPYPWLTFGIDLIIGNGADSVICKRNELFLPVELKEAFDRAYVENDSLQKRPLVISSETVIHSDTQETGKSWSNPMKLGIVMVIHCLVFATIGFFMKKRYKFFFCLMFLNVALAGCVVAFMALFSEHPCTWPNWNLLWVHPLHFIPVVGYFLKKTYSLIRWYHWSNFVLLSCLLLGWNFIPQEMNLACIPFIICLWISSGYKLLMDKRLNQ